jgi:hypothetical protein
MLISADYEGFLKYFESWAANDPDVKFFLDGGVENGLDYATGHPDFEYPFAWLESPEIETIEEPGQLIDRYVFGVSVITKADIGDRVACKQASIDTMRIVYNLQKKLRLDNKKKSGRATGGFLEVNLGSMKKQEVDRGWAGNHRGWRLSLVLDLNANAVML